MDDEYRRRLDSIIHHAAEAETAINAENWEAASLEVALIYYAAFELQRQLPHPDITTGTGL